ncbi:MAG: methylenetetrahydrofolate--tRNA-(uracil(54)-C(5))-methyltransferase (FADH(2)-oxidizing) TrmFO [Bacilli bacterium]|nr:methylenetetrahydrofolate--tRNA-(uracil(54)-C(5))-methyltransferase (FADH(2)-oxidizing) TrmFO [Bacilli bacterium]
MQEVNIIGAGLAGCEAAYQLSKRNVKVNLYEMRPKKMTEAHKSANFGELVCSNSLRGDQLTNAVGVLKRELLMLDSIVISIAYEHKVPAGAALAVDRDGFSLALTNKIKSLENVSFFNEEVIDIDLNVPTIIATGPLTSASLANKIKELTHEDSLYFFDAIAPIIEKDSIDFTKAYYKSRYDKDEASYINCAMTNEEFDVWYEELINAKCTKLKDFEKLILFEGCMPIEEMARRGKKTLLFGPLKPVGLWKDDNHRACAIVQLRQDDAKASLYNLVGFQTHLTWPEQKRIIQMIPGLEKANIVRYGVMHRNTYLNAPRFLKPTFQSNINDNLFFAGQVSGVEGYVESIASGLMASLNMYQYLNNKKEIIFPTETICGSMANYITTSNPASFQPMNANFGIVKDLSSNIKKKERKEAYANRALKVMEDFINEYKLT